MRKYICFITAIHLSTSSNSDQYNNDNNLNISEVKHLDNLFANIEEMDDFESYYNNSASLFSNTDTFYLDAEEIDKNIINDNNLFNIIDKFNLDSEETDKNILDDNDFNNLQVINEEMIFEESIKNIDDNDELTANPQEIAGKSSYTTNIISPTENEIDSIDTDSIDSFMDNFSVYLSKEDKSASNNIKSKKQKIKYIKEPYELKLIENLKKIKTLVENEKKKEYNGCRLYDTFLTKFSSLSFAEHSEKKFYFKIFKTLISPIRFNEKVDFESDESKKESLFDDSAKIFAENEILIPRKTLIRIHKKANLFYKLFENQQKLCKLYMNEVIFNRLNNGYVSTQILSCYDILQDYHINILLKTAIDRILSILEQNKFDKKIKKYHGYPFNSFIINISNLYYSVMPSNLIKNNKTIPKVIRALERYDFNNSIHRIISELKISTPKREYELKACFDALFSIYHISYILSNVLMNILAKNEIDQNDNIFNGRCSMSLKESLYSILLLK